MVLLRPPASLVYNEHPWLARYDDWLAPKTLKRIRKRCVNTVPFETGRVKTAEGHRVTDQRQADNYVIRDHSDEILTGLAQKVADFIGWHTDHMEPGVLVRYREGGYFRAHRDWNIQTWNGVTSHRIASFLIYVNDDFQGGTTSFPMLDLQIQPRAGTALYYDFSPGTFCNDVLLHSGDPVTAGTKYLLCFFARDLPFLGRQREKMNY